MSRYLLMLIFLLTGCASGVKNSANGDAEIFKDKKGCFLLYNMKTQNFEKVIGEEECKKQYPAASTFKVPLAVIAFDSKILKDVNQVYKWDGKKNLRDEENKDHNAKTWMSESIVWFSQRITSKLGKAKLQKYLKDFNYGNQDLTAGLTVAWIEKPSDTKPALKISAYEQVEFMKKLWTTALPASERAQEIARQLTFLEISPKGYALNGKTGSNFFDKERKLRFGWFVAHLQKDNEEYIAVTQFSDVLPKTEEGYGGPVAKAMTKKLLEAHNLW